MIKSWFSFVRKASFWYSVYMIIASFPLDTLHMYKWDHSSFVEASPYIVLYTILVLLTSYSLWIFLRQGFNRSYNNKEYEAQKKTQSQEMKNNNVFHWFIIINRSICLFLLLNEHSCFATLTPFLSSKKHILHT